MYMESACDKRTLTKYFKMSHIVNLNTRNMKNNRLVFLTEE